MNIPRPTQREIDKAQKEWNKLADYVAREEALEKLFKKTYPKNSEFNDILIKVSVLNSFYSTRIYLNALFLVFKKIFKLRIDERLKKVIIY